MEPPVPKQKETDQERYSPEEAQRRVEAMIRASRRPPLHLKDVPRKRPQAKRKAGRAAKPSPSEPS
jgi:hypothetical protein